MPKQANAEKRTGILARLRKDQGGNTIAMFAAAVFPIAGLVGGGLDMSRIYLVRTRLQAACDAGALAGRKQMGVGTWAASSGRANTEAVRMFNLNFKPNAYGTISTTPVFVENSGSVTGTASATIPMTLMRIFGNEEKSVSVNCNAAMSIPNTDIMFVLDTTGSMTSAPNGQTVTASNPSKIVGLRKVAKCFYESLAKINISSVSPADCNETSDPSGGNVAGSQIRFGFVPYSSNVNVGKLLPHDYMADSFTYQSRQPILTPKWVYSLGTEGAKTFGSYNNPTAPTTQTSGWANINTTNTNGNATINGSSYATINTATTTTACNSSSPVPATSNNEPGTEYDTTNAASTTPPTYPATTNPYGNYTRHLPRTVRFYRYNRNAISGTTKCRLQHATATYEQTKTGTTSKPVTWTQYNDVFVDWEYKPVLHNVSGIKNPGGGWNSTFSLPTDYVTQTLLISGTNGQSVRRVVGANVTWDGCIEERLTKRLSSWSPYPSDSPDLDLRTAPTGDNDSQWKPSINGGIWARYNGTTAYYPTITEAGNLSRATNVSYACPSQARLLAEYNDAAGATSFSNYLDGLNATGSTYHDIGMLWGARMVLPDGIFSANNQSGTTNGIDRNIIFMTDGDTDSGIKANTAYGLSFWDRRQEADTAVAPSEADIDTKINARFVAICEQLTDVENVTVWVVSFGGTGISTVTKNRLKQCATDDAHYFDAADTAGLLTSFKAIASAISQLRLTN